MLDDAIGSQWADTSIGTGSIVQWQVGNNGVWVCMHMLQEAGHGE